MFRRRDVFVKLFGDNFVLALPRSNARPATEKNLGNICYYERKCIVGSDKAVVWTATASGYPCRHGAYALPAPECSSIEYLDERPPYYGVTRLESTKQFQEVAFAFRR